VNLAKGFTGAPPEFAGCPPSRPPIRRLRRAARCSKRCTSVTCGQRWRTYGGWTTPSYTDPSLDGAQTAGELEPAGNAYPSSNVVLISSRVETRTSRIRTPGWPEGPASTTRLHPRIQPEGTTRQGTGSARRQNGQQNGHMRRSRRTAGSTGHHEFPRQLPRFALICLET